MSTKACSTFFAGVGPAASTHAASISSTRARLFTRGNLSQNRSQIAAVIAAPSYQLSNVRPDGRDAWLTPWSGCSRAVLLFVGLLAAISYTTYAVTATTAQNHHFL